MLTSRRIDKTRGGHGVTWNDDRLRPAHRAGRRRAPGRLGVLAAGGRRAAAPRCSRPRRSSRSTRGPGPRIDRSLVTARQPGAATPGRRRPVPTGRGRSRSCTSRAPDVAGHASGWLSPEYLTAVRKTDRQIGRVLVRPLPRPRAARPHAAHRHRRTTAARAPATRTPPPTPTTGSLSWSWVAGVPADVDLYEPQPDVRRPRHHPPRLRRRAPADPQRRRRQPGPRRPRPAAHPPQRARLQPGPRRLRSRRLRRDEVSSRNRGTGQVTATTARSPAATGCDDNRTGPWTAASSPAPGVLARDSRGGRGRASGRSRG